jgi:hypothetical protein
MTVQTRPDAVAALLVEQARAVLPRVHPDREELP